MSGEVISFSTRKAVTTAAGETKEQAIARALKVHDLMREKIASGEVAAFMAVCIYPDDLTTVFRSTITECSYLRVAGAFAFALARITDRDSDI